MLTFDRSFIMVFAFIVYIIYLVYGLQTSFSHAIICVFKNLLDVFPSSIHSHLESAIVKSYDSLLHAPSTNTSEDEYAVIAKTIFGPVISESVVAPIALPYQLCVLRRIARLVRSS